VNLILAVNERLDEQRRIVAYLDSFPLARDLRQARLASHKGMISLRGLQSATGEELSAMLPPVLRPAGGAFKGEL
jgi:hypothetical protein